MNFDRIVCVPDLVRGLRSFPESIFDLVREPILQGAGINIGFPPGGKKMHGLAPDFDLNDFRTRAGMDADTFSDSTARQSQWTATYYQLPDEAVEYLFCHLPTCSLVLSFEMPNWLAQACTVRGVDFLVVRPSPLRFGRDLYIALRCSSETLFRRIGAHGLSSEELRLEAALLGANVRMHQSRLEHERGFEFEDLDSSLVFVGQVPWDTSLLAPGGRSLRCTDYADELRALCHGRRLVHKGHPLALAFVQSERDALQHITGQTPQPCKQNAYQILSSEDDLALAGISSGMLQEAAWFDKAAHCLFQPFVPLTSADAPTTAKYQQIHFQTLLSPVFWHQVLAPERLAPRLAALPQLAHHHARETFDLWWDYSKVITWERKLPYEAFMRSGGVGLLQRIESLERKINQQSGSLPHTGHDFSLNSGERQVATRYEDIRADHRYRYEWADARLPKDGYGVDVFCGNGYGAGYLARTRRILGIDGSLDAIRLARQHYQTSNVFFSQACYPFELPRDTFDFVISLESVEHVKNDDGFISMLVRSLKLGGLFLFSVPCESHLPHAKLSDVFHFHHRHYSFEEVNRLININGLEMLEWAGQDVYSYTAQGKLTPFTNPAHMQLESNTIRQFIIFLCRKTTTPAELPS